MGDHDHDVATFPELADIPLRTFELPSGDAGLAGSRGDEVVPLGEIHESDADAADLVRKRPPRLFVVHPRTQVPDAEAIERPHGPGESLRAEVAAVVVRQRGDLKTGREQTRQMTLTRGKTR